MDNYDFSVITIFVVVDWNIFKTHISKKDHQSLFQLMILNKLNQIFSTRALNDSTFKEIFGDFVKNEIVGFMKSIDDLTAAMKRSFILEYLMAPMDTDKAGDVVDVLTSLEFIEKQMKTIKAKHALYYFNCK